MTSKRLYLLLLGCIGLLAVALIAGTYGAHSLLATQARALTKLKAQSAALDQEQLSLKKAERDIKTHADLVKITKAVVPEDKDQAEAVREIVNIAAANGIDLASVTFPASSLGGTASGGTSASPSPAGAAQGPSSGSSKSGGLSQLTPVKSISGVYSLQITVTSSIAKPVPYSKFITFLSNLEHNRRTAQVNTISIQPDKNNSALLSFTLGLNEYIKP